MVKTTIDRRETSFFSKTANTLVYNQEKLSSYLNQPFSEENLFNQIALKNENYNHKFRQTLSEVLIESYTGIDNKNAVVENTMLLEQKDTFTITTGHQLNLFTGPIFFIYKIMHVIKLAEQLKEKHPEYNFVPVYWMASEDHDFEEINHTNLFNNKIEWETNQAGAVGRFNLNDFEAMKLQVASFFENQEEVKTLIEIAYQQEDSLANATLKLVHKLFGDKGLLILDADHAKLKSLFRPVLFKEIQENFSEKAVLSTSSRLEEEGYKIQVSPREINLFFLSENSRDRIIQNEDKSFQCGDITCSSIELLELIDAKPALFSPNVVLRPVYQEWILPNLCYVGGGGEMAYWLQLKGVFDALDLTYPLIQVRNSVQFIDNTSAKKLTKLGLSFTDFLNSLEEIKKKFVAENSDDELTFEKLDVALEGLTNQIKDNATRVEEGLTGYAESEIARVTKQLDQFKSKLTRHQKKKFDDGLKQIDSVYSRLFPNGGLQERYENVLAYFGKHGIDNFLDEVYNATDPFEKDLIVLS